MKLSIKCLLVLAVVTAGSMHPARFIRFSDEEISDALRNGKKMLERIEEEIARLAKQKETIGSLSAYMPKTQELFLTIPGEYARMDALARQEAEFKKNPALLKKFSKQVAEALKTWEQMRVLTNYLYITFHSAEQNPSKLYGVSVSESGAKRIAKDLGDVIKVYDQLFAQWVQRARLGQADIEKTAAAEKYEATLVGKIEKTSQKVLSAAENVAALFNERNTQWMTQKQPYIAALKAAVAEFKDLAERAAANAWLENKSLFKEMATQCKKVDESLNDLLVRAPNYSSLSAKDAESLLRKISANVTTFNAFVQSFGAMSARASKSALVTEETKKIRAAVAAAAQSLKQLFAFVAQKTQRMQESVRKQANERAKLAQKLMQKLETFNAATRGQLWLLSPAINLAEKWADALQLLSQIADSINAVSLKIVASDLPKLMTEARQDVKEQHWINGTMADHHSDRFKLKISVLEDVQKSTAVKSDSVVGAAVDALIRLYKRCIEDMRKLPVSAPKK